MAVRKKFQLGRGLDALISTEEIKTEGSSSINEIEIASIVRNPDQPRRDFDPEALNELADSIREIGIVQPITLRQMPDNKYQIIAGERRYRASIMAGLTTVPAYVRTVDDESMMEMALIENIQREDLNSLEIALAYQHLIEQYHLTQDRLSERVGKKRATIANYLRLLKLPAQVQVGLQNKAIDMGHARALLSLDNPKLQMQLYKDILKEGYSVRRVEELVKEMNEAIGDPTDTKAGKQAASTNAKSNEVQEHFNMLRKSLSHYFNTKVGVSVGARGKGKITLSFNNEQELERIISLFDKLTN